MSAHRISMTKQPCKRPARPAKSVTSHGISQGRVPCAAAAAARWTSSPTFSKAFGGSDRSGPSNVVSRTPLIRNRHNGCCFPRPPGTYTC
eukprot:10407861-Alexandrium_andersonii.AAC.1